jgi:hypothetical protein
MHHAIDKHYIFLREQGLCYHCQKAIAMGKTTLDHYLPRSKGGTYDVFNLVACCKRCNNYKKSTMPSDVDAVHVCLFRRAASDRKLDPAQLLTFTELAQLAQTVDRVVHQGEVTLFESPSHRISVKNNRIVKIIQLNRNEKG